MTFVIGFLAVLGGIIITILMVMVMIRLPYLMIKHLRVSCKLSQELKKNTRQQKQAIQQLRNDQGEMKRQNLVRETLDAKMRFLNFKESLPLYPKECKIILFVFMLVLFLQATFSIANFGWWQSDMVGFILLLCNLIWLGFIFFVPIIGLMGIKLTKKLRKTLQQLEEAIQQRDQAIRMLNVEGGQNDE
ncbi:MULTISPECIES: hypothetical protein [unclassified Bartonella]|uniref:hypothetical protein n=1 Tax=unclassified Bartonella TaxID=2645622 RepID=UPI0035CF44ED